MNCVDCGSLSVAEERCADCLEEVAETPNWRSRPVQAVPRLQQEARTAGCGHPVPTRVGRPPNLCAECAPPVKPPRVAPPRRPCQHCHEPIKSRRSEARFCSLACVGMAKAAARPPHLTCAESGCEKPSRRKDLCKHHARLRYPMPSDLAHARKRNQLKNHVRRGRARAPETELIDRDVVGDRDGWRCGICHRKVDRTKVYPHPRSPSLDHVIPQSEHGPHTYANVRISHLVCNVSRSDRGGDEQLALLG